MLESVQPSTGRVKIGMPRITPPITTLEIEVDKHNHSQSSNGTGLPSSQPVKKIESEVVSPSEVTEEVSSGGVKVDQTLVQSNITPMGKIIQKADEVVRQATQNNMKEFPADELIRKERERLISGRKFA